MAEEKEDAKKAEGEAGQEEVKKEAPKPEKKEDAKEEPVKEKKEESSSEKPEASGEEEVKKETKKKKPGKLAVVHVYSSKNDTIITATDISGAETLSWASGGMMVKSSREEGKPYAAMQAAQKVVGDLKEKGVDTVHIKIRAPGGNGQKTPGSGAKAVVRAIARMKVRVGRIEDVTPVPTDSMKRAGGRRGRRV
ncbi:30S ribosomal protein S11 [Candidatus Micrarchaeota archaeon]|nr:30S ribosomal protein S11 [Candidatus Micrarchaeota archaeon]